MPGSSRSGFGSGSCCGSPLLALGESRETTVIIVYFWFGTVEIDRVYDR